MKFLSESGLTYFLNKLKGLFLTITDFNKVYDNGVIDAKQIIHKTNSGSSTNYDLVLGNKTDDESDSYIKIDSTRSVNSDGNNKLGAIDINTKNSLRVNADNNVTITSKYSQGNNLEYGIIEITNSEKPAMRSYNKLGSSAYNNELTVYSEGISLKSYFTNTGIDSENRGITFRVDNDNIYAFKSTNIYNDSIDKLLSIETSHSTQDTDKIQFLRYKEGSTNISALDIRPTQIKCWTDAFSIKKGKEIKFKTSSENSVRLTEGQGFKVFANMYAMPDNATDISEYTEEEQQLLANNTVQKLILKLNSSKASAKTVKKIAKQTIPSTQVCIRKSIRPGSLGHGIKYFHKGVPTIKLGYYGKTMYYKLVDTEGNILSLDKYTNPRVKDMNNGVYAVTLPTVQSDDDIKKKYSNIFYIYNVKLFDAKLTEVEAVDDQIIDGLDVQVITLKFTSAKYYTGKTTTPKISIVDGVACGSFCPTTLPFSSYTSNNDEYKTYIKYEKQKINIFINKYCIYKRNRDKAGYKRRLYLGNRNYSGVDLQNTALNKYSGIALLVYYYKGIRIGSRNIYVTRKGFFRE